jgi:glycine/D-amino acid oxidase-like deaminating enzyme
VSDFISTASAIDPSTIQAYRETHFCVEGETPMTLLVGERNEALAALHEASGVESSAFVTAWNPFSQQCDDETNANRQQALADELIVLGLRFVQGVGRHPSCTWAEPSFLVLGISLAAAKELGRGYEQNAIVWNGVDAVPELVLLR